MKEADLKLAVSDYLKYGTNQGRWYASRLNSGIAYIKRGDKYYAITLCEEGTADFMVIMGNREMVWKQLEYRKCDYSYQNLGRRSKVIFLELKGDKGKQRPEQGAFQKLVEAQGAEYAVIRSIEELENVLV